ncbi:MAG: hypothetical protein EPO68_13920 [Planctomycetota bacterium]|nr:MAG: hypothetical protein EPO68_13920 [Planctomycetota bacterium]
MSQTTPDHRDAELVLRLYEMRREAVTRESRKTISFDFLPRSYDDLLSIAQPKHPHNAAWRQMSSYWEMVYGLGRHSIVHAEYLVENSGEGLLLYSKVKPYVERYRQDFSPFAFQNAQWAAERTERGRALVAIFEKRIATQLAAAKS